MKLSTRIKSLLKRFPIFRRLAGGTEQQVESHQRRLDTHDIALRDLTNAVEGLQQRADLLERHLPDLLNAISSSHGSQRQVRREVDALSVAVGEGLGGQWQRIEMIRKELLFELRYGDREAVVDAAPKVLDEERWNQGLQSGLRLNLGCGHLPLPDYVNVDMRDLPGVDVVAPVDNLPAQAGQVAEVFSAHLVEHFPQEQLVRDLLPYWVGLLRPGGTFRAVVPDAGAMLEAHARGDYSYDDLREVLYGGQEYEGDFHFNMYTPETLAELLADAGLVDIAVEDRGRPNGACLEFQIAGSRPADG